MPSPLPLEVSQSRWPCITTAPIHNSSSLLFLYYRAERTMVQNELFQDKNTWSDCGYQEILLFWFCWISNLFWEKQTNKPYPFGHFTSSSHHPLHYFLLTAKTPLPSTFPPKGHTHGYTLPRPFIVTNGTITIPVSWTGSHDFPASFIHVTSHSILNLKTLSFGLFLPLANKWCSHAPSLL